MVFGGSFCQLCKVENMSAWKVTRKTLFYGMKSSWKEPRSPLQAQLCEPNVLGEPPVVGWTRPLLCEGMEKRSANIWQMMEISEERKTPKLQDEEGMMGGSIKRERKTDSQSLSPLSALTFSWLSVCELWPSEKKFEETFSPLFSLSNEHLPVSCSPSARHFVWNATSIT